MAKRTAKPRWTWKDDYRLEVAQMDNAELDAWEKHFTQQAAVSTVMHSANFERQAEKLIIIREKLAKRTLNAQHLIESAFPQEVIL